MIKYISLVFAVVVIAACGSRKKDAYTRLAREANPILVALKPGVKTLLAVPAHDHAAVVAACDGAAEPLWQLRKVRFDADEVQPAHGKPLASEFAEWLLDHRKLQCGHGPSYDVEWCSQWCLDHWNGLIEEIERLRREAKKEGVELVSLRPEA